MTHTPGPWLRTNLTIHTQSSKELPALKIARVFEAGVETEAASTVAQATANARLIAAAPDLLEALRHGCDLLDGMGLYYLEGGAAIAKATRV